MKLWIFILVSLASLSLAATKRVKNRKNKAPKLAARVANADLSENDLAANISALWERVNRIGTAARGGVQIHVHGMGEERRPPPRMDDRADGTHIHLHMHLDDDHPRRHHDEHPRGNHGHDNDTHDYEYAVCHVHANAALPSGEQQPINGAIYFRQKHHRHLEVKVHLSGFDMSGEHASHLHGLHVHEFGDLHDGCQSLGSHFNPDHMEHGGPEEEHRHSGDYGNIECDENGDSYKTFFNHHTDLEGHYGVLGKGLVIHKTADDLADSGSAGDRIACCVVVSATIDDWDTILGEHEGQNVDDADHHEGPRYHRRGPPGGHHGDHHGGPPRGHHDDHHGDHHDEHHDDHHKDHDDEHKDHKDHKKENKKNKGPKKNRKNKIETST